MKQYSQNNYIEWIGEIPRSWKISKIGELYSIKNIKVNDEDYPPLSVTKKGIVPQLENAAKSDAHDNRKLVNKGDFVINSRSDRRGSCGISSLDGSVSLINIVLSPKSNLNSEYFNWLFHTDLFADEFYRWGHGIVDDLWTTNWQNMKNINIPNPPFDMQKTIANFLNKKCNFIDTLISDEIGCRDKLIEYKLSLITESVTKGLTPNVEMKDSGVEWIGEIPEHWEIGLLKYLAELLNIKQEFANKSDKYIGLENIESKSGRLLGYSTNGTDGSVNKFQKENILFGKLRPYLSKVIIAPFDGVCSTEILVYAPNEDILTKFLFYYMLSNRFIEIVNSTTYGVKMPRASPDIINNMHISIPPLKEQKQIVNYLDKKCNLIDSLISKKEQVIDKLEEYKKSLIFEYVTGKKEVPK